MQRSAGSVALGVFALSGLVGCGGAADPAPTKEARAGSVASALVPGPGSCDPLPPPSGNVIEIASGDVASLAWAVSHVAQPGDTILLGAGTYALTTSLYVERPGITIRGAGGDRGAVVIDAGYTASEPLSILAADVTVADLTIVRAGSHAIHVQPGPGGGGRTLVHNVHLADARAQAIKINANAYGYPDDGVVRCSRLELTDAGRPFVSQSPRPCYTGGIDAHQARGWHVHDNTVQGYYCATSFSDPAIFFWTGSRDTLVERNVVLDSRVGIGFGLYNSVFRRYPEDPHPCEDRISDTSFIGHYDGVIRNNFVAAAAPALFASEYGFSNGISLENACGTAAVHNTVASTEPPRYRSIEYRLPNSDVRLYNDLVTHSIGPRESGQGEHLGNVEGAPLAAFVDVVGGDLHLAPGTAGIVDAGASLSFWPGIADEDIDREWRDDAARDVGADEAQ
jgi:hypothetical protein